MSDETTPDLTALIERAYGCKPGAIHEGYGAECDSSAHAPALYRTFGCDHAAHLAEQITAAGFGPVRAVEAEREVRIGAKCPNGSIGACHSIRCGSNCSHDYDRMHPCMACVLNEFRATTARAESAEAALAGLREQIAQAIEACDDYNDDRDGSIAAHIARSFAPTPDREEARDE